MVWRGEDLAAAAVAVATEERVGEWSGEGTSCVALSMEWVLQEAVAARQREGRRYFASIGEQWREG
jgi:hypothetical protein